MEVLVQKVLGLAKGFQLNIERACEIQAVHFACKSSCSLCGSLGMKLIENLMMELNGVTKGIIFSFSVI